MGIVSKLRALVAACCVLAPTLVCLFPWCDALCASVWRYVLPVCHMLFSVQPWLDVFGTYMGHGIGVLVAGLLFCVLCHIAWMCSWPSCCGCLLSMLFTTGGISIRCLDVFVAYVLCFVVSAPLSEGVCIVFCAWCGLAICVFCASYTFPGCINRL